MVRNSDAFKIGCREAATAAAEGLIVKFAINPTFAVLEQQIMAAKEWQLAHLAEKYRGANSRLNGAASALVQLCFDFYMIEAKPENLIGDRAYDSDPLDEQLRCDGIKNPFRRF